MLLGDLGVAVSLVDDQPKINTSPTRRINFETSFAVPHTTRPSAPYSRPKIRKRKSFVGTVSYIAQIQVPRILTVSVSAMLDGTRGYSGQTIRFKRRYLVIWNHRSRTLSRPSTTLEGYPSYHIITNVSLNLGSKQMLILVHWLLLAFKVLRRLLIV